MPHDNPRQPLIDMCLERQTEAFKAAFREFAVDFFTERQGKVETVVELYKASGNPQPANDFRCIGGMVQAMVRNGEIEVRGVEKAKDGSGRLMPVYGRRRLTTENTEVTENGTSN